MTKEEREAVTGSYLELVRCGLVPSVPGEEAQRRVAEFARFSGRPVTQEDHEEVCLLIGDGLEEMAREIVAWWRQESLKVPPGMPWPITLDAALDAAPWRLPGMPVEHHTPGEAWFAAKLVALGAAQEGAGG